MKKLIFVLILIFSLGMLSVNAQVSININGDPAEDCAILDVSSGTKGLLIPRVILTEELTSPAPIEATTMVNGLLIYNEGTTHGIDQGFYYWTGTPGVDGKWNLLFGDDNTTFNTIAQNLYQAAELYEDHGWASGTPIFLEFPSQDYGWVSAVEGEVFGDATFDVDNLTADQIIIGDEGLYEIDFSVSFGGTNNAQITAAVWHTPKDGSADGTRIRTLTKLKSNGDLESSATHGLIRLGFGDVIDIRFNSTSAGETLEIYNVNLVVNKVGE